MVSCDGFPADLDLMVSAVLREHCGYGRLRQLVEDKLAVSTAPPRRRRPGRAGGWLCSRDTCRMLCSLHFVFIVFTAKNLATRPPTHPQPPDSQVPRYPTGGVAKCSMTLLLIAGVRG